MKDKWIRDGYKVVAREDDGRLVSPTAIGTPDGFCYTPMAWAEAPKGWGPLAAYSALQRAIAGLADSYSDGCHVLRLIVSGAVQIWECAWIPWTSPLLVDDQGVRIFWSDKCALPITLVPSGTVLCRAVRLIRRVDVGMIAEFLEPVAVVERLGRKRHVIPGLSVKGVRLWVPMCWSTYEWGVEAPIRQYIQDVLQDIRRKSPKLARIAKAAFQVADDLARAQGINQPPFIGGVA